MVENNAREGVLEVRQIRICSSRCYEGGLFSGSLDAVDDPPPHVLQQGDVFRT